MKLLKILFILHLKLSYYACIIYNAIKKEENKNIKEEPGEMTHPVNTSMKQT